MPSQTPTVDKELIHQALKDVKKKKGTLTNDPSHLLLLRQLRAENSMTDLTDNYEAALRIINKGLSTIGSQNSFHEKILRGHFIDDKRHKELASEHGVSTAVIKNNQGDAIERLAELLDEQEQALREADYNRVIKKLTKLRQNNPLVGVDEQMAYIMQNLLDPSIKDVVFVTGLGGIGKTALMETAVSDLAHHHHFHDIVWLTIHSEQNESGPLTLEHIRTDLINEMGHNNWHTKSAKDQTIHLSYIFEQRPHLVIIDNVETDLTQKLLDTLYGWSGPSRFVLTSRHNVRPDIPHQQIKLNGLLLESSAELIADQIENTPNSTIEQIEDEQVAGIYKIVGGNPLALKLALGLLHTLPFHLVTQDLEEGLSKDTVKMYTHIYQKLWTTLSADGRTLLQKMVATYEGGVPTNLLERLSKLPMDSLLNAVQELVERSLLDKSLEVANPTYVIHRLTRAFLKTEIIGWIDDYDWEGQEKPLDEAAQTDGDVDDSNSAAANDD